MARAGDRSWTVAPTLLWFGAALIAGACLLSGGLAGLKPLRARLVTRDESVAVPAGPVFAASPDQLAEADDDNDNDDDVVPAAGGGAGSATGGSTSAPRDGFLFDTCRDGTPEHCRAWAMDGFYRAIADEKRGALGHPVRVSWYGDSVVATDLIPGRLRSRMQADLGDGGPGFVFVVPPHRFCEHEGVTRDSSGTWMSHAISTLQTPDGLYGPGGATAETFDGGTSTLKLADQITNVELYALAQPHGGRVIVHADGADVLHADTAADAKQVSYATAKLDGGASKLELETHGKVRLFGLDLENASGAVVDNLGIVSVHVKSFANEDAAHWSAELAHRGADLVMIMIGANEAEWLGPADQDTKDYQAHYEQVLAPIRKARPEAACLVVSPTDQAFEQDGGYASRPVMPILVAAQRKAAEAQGCAFFSTYAWMGGKGSSAKWFRKRLVSSDFQHLSKKGADLLGDAIYTALMAGAERYAHR
ncbi:MAG TPA: GDSL-type esterase/lipase family protein [Kofleriaceae bacterium]